MVQKIIDDIRGALSGPVIRKMIVSFPRAVISISHDRKYIDEVCTKVFALTEGD